MAKWKCGRCGYIHDGDAPPDICPVCGAPKERFSPIEKKDITKLDRIKNGVYRRFLLKRR